MLGQLDEDGVRQSVLAWLSDVTGFGQDLHFFTWQELWYGFSVGGKNLPLVSQSGIWTPRSFSSALSIRTRFTAPGEVPPYDDVVGGDGRLRYKYRGEDPEQFDNRALRAALERGSPLIWFWGVARTPALYRAIWPVWIVDEEEHQHQFVVAVDEAQRLMPAGRVMTDVERRYVERLTRQRVHQPVFRARVVAAYGRQCAVCRLRYVSLLDAAHILPDGHPKGSPVVPNGLSLCKIHHAAFDQNLIGIRPDRVSVEVRQDVRHARDGPMLLHGLQEMQGTKLVVPRRADARPDRERLEERWEEFRRATG